MGRHVTRLAAVVVAVVGAVGAGCATITTPIPGVLDLRSDAADAEPMRAPIKPGPQAREGFDALTQGSGVATGDAGGADIVVNQRAFWLLRLMKLGEAGVDDELGIALGKTSALRTVTIREETSALEAAAYWCTLPIPCVDVATALLLPSMTLTIEGTRVQTPSSPQQQPAPPVEPAPVSPAAPPSTTPATPTPTAPNPPPLPKEPTPTPSLDRPSPKESAQ